MGIVYVSPERMWDTWLFQEGDEYHLFFPSNGDIGRAVSRDLIHWRHLPPIENLAAAGDWDAQGMRVSHFFVHGDPCASRTLTDSTAQRQRCGRRRGAGRRIDVAATRRR